MAVSAPNEQNPPQRLLIRTANVATGVMNTLRIPGDVFIDRSGTWFNDAAAVRRGNEVKFMVDAKNTYREMEAAIRTATKAGHFIYMSNWFVDLDLNLGRGTDLRTLLAAADKSGVMVRAMFWDQVFSSQNTEPVGAINALRNGAAILDGTGNPILPVPILGILKIPMRFGSQHQKLLCVLGDDGLICFCGGIDFNPDRLSNTGGGAPLHDVHCRIRGPAASELLKTFVQRWNDHPQGRVLNRPPNPNQGKDFLGNTPPPGGKGPLIASDPAPATPGAQMVRIGRTFKTGLYGFAPGGEFTAAEVISSAIRNARRFIHTEDQYFVGNKRLTDALVASLEDGLKHLTVVLTHFKISDLLRVHEHRRIFINRLKQTGGDRVRIFFRDPGGLAKAFDDGKVDHSYVHAKTWIMDDEFAVIGSVNSNNRSWTHDTEVCSGIYDITGNNQILNYHLAHKLRIELWQEHLGMQGDIGAAELWDGVASGVHWLKNNRPPGAQVQDYDVNERGDHFFTSIPIAGGLINSELVYDTFCDPA